jgi:predicted permease
MHYRWKTFLPPMMFSNTGNMGLPLILLTFGEQALPAAIILLVLENFLHFTIGQQMITQRWSFLFLLKNPMVIATLAGITVSEFNLVIPEVALLPVNMLGQISIPLMLFSLGVRLTTLDFKDWRIGLAGAVICPLSGLLVVLSLAPWLNLPADQFPILILFSVLPPAVLNFLVAEQFEQEPHLVASIVLIGNLAAVLTIPLALWFIL